VRAVRIAAGIAGLALTLWLIRQTGLTVLWERLEELSWRLALILVPSAMVAVVEAIGWQYAFPRGVPSLRHAIAARLAGEAVNDTTPTGTVGGEPLKAWLVASIGVPLEEGLVSVVVAKTALIGSQVVFLLVGLLLAVVEPGTPPVLRGGLTVLTLTGLAATIGFIWAQTRGLFRAGSRAFAWLGLEALAGMGTRLDSGVRAYYRDRRPRLVVATAWLLIGWALGSLEVWLTLAFLGAPVTLATAVVIEACATGIRSAGFLVPAAAGVQEGGLVGIFASLGVGADVGLTVALVRRLREAVWAAAGYGVVAAWPGAAAAAPPPRG
jgi:glycosyltransferase 2 family protein